MENNSKSSVTVNVDKQGQYSVKTKVYEDTTKEELRRIYNEAMAVADASNEYIATKNELGDPLKGY